MRRPALGLPTLGTCILLAATGSYKWHSQRVEEQNRQREEQQQILEQQRQQEIAICHAQPQNYLDRLIGPNC